jgi:hypothetical protein
VRIKITQAAVERAPLATDRSATYTDTELRGFMLLVGRTSRGYYAQTLVNGRQVRVKVGDHPTLTAKEAREAARQKLASMRVGTNPNEEKRRARARGITLRQALDLHLGAKERSAKTEEGYRYQAEQYLSDWLDRPLCEIGTDRAGVRERHRPDHRAQRQGDRRLLDAGAACGLQPGHEGAPRPAAKPMRQRRLPRDEAQAGRGRPRAAEGVGQGRAEAQPGNAVGEARRVVPVRVKQCSMPTLFRDLVYIDFAGKSEEEQRRALTAGLRAAMVGSTPRRREIKERPPWPGGNEPRHELTDADEQNNALPLRVQFVACDVGRGLDLKGQFNAIKAAIEGSKSSKEIILHSDFDVTDANLFTKLNSYQPHVVHISGNQNGGDVLLPSHDGGEVVVPDEALAGLLSSLGSGLRLAIVDTCRSYRCAKRVSEVVDCAIGVDDDIFDHEATRFYEVFYLAIGAGRSIADAHRQAAAALQFMHVPRKRIPQLCVKAEKDASQLFLVH